MFLSERRAILIQTAVVQIESHVAPLTSIRDWPDIYSHLELLYQRKPETRELNMFVETFTSLALLTEPNIVQDPRITTHHIRDILSDILWMFGTSINDPRQPSAFRESISNTFLACAQRILPLYRLFVTKSLTGFPGTGFGLSARSVEVYNCIVVDPLAQQSGEDWDHFHSAHVALHLKKIAVRLHYGAKPTSDRIGSDRAAVDDLRTPLQQLRKGRDWPENGWSVDWHICQLNGLAVWSPGGAVRTTHSHTSYDMSPHVHNIALV